MIFLKKKKQEHKCGYLFGYVFAYSLRQQKSFKNSNGRQFPLNGKTAAPAVSFKGPTWVSDDQVHTTVSSGHRPLRRGEMSKRTRHYSVCKHETVHWRNPDGYSPWVV